MKHCEQHPEKLNDIEQGDMNEGIAVNTVSAMEKNTKEDKICHTNCKHLGSNPKTRSLSAISCWLCCHQYHSDCVDCDDPKSAWTCPICRLMPDTVNSLASKLDQILKQNSDLINMMQKQQEEINVLKDISQNSQREVMAHDTYMKLAVSQITDAKQNTNDRDDDSDSDTDDDDVEPSGMLLVGDSLIRNVKSTCDNLKVSCLNGAKFHDLKKFLKRINPKRKKYTDIVIICGTNDLSTKKPADKIAMNCKSVLQLALERANNVRLSSVLPRNDDKADHQKLDNLNQLLVTIAEELNVTFINNSKNFLCQDGSIVETMLLSDGLHLSQQGVKKLLQNLSLHEKTKTEFGIMPKSMPGRPVQKEGPVSSSLNKPSDAVNVQIPPPVLDSVGTLKFRGERNTFSNFFLTPITVWGMTFKSTEHAYNYRKAVEMAHHTAAEEIRHAESGLDAMRIAESISTSDHWSNIKQSVMYQLLQVKATQCSDFRSDLVASRGKLLVEDTSHDFWGRGNNGDGLNMLGRLLMVLRDNLPPLLSTQPRSSWKPPFKPHFQTMNHSYGTAPNAPSTQLNRQRSFPNRPEFQMRCYNCGERSHNQKTCRFSSPIQCYGCSGYGHKQKNCVRGSTRSTISQR